jgi:RNA recognition motif-containing protein
VCSLYSLSTTTTMSKRNKRVIHIYNIPESTTGEQILGMFSEFGSIVSVRLEYDRRTQQQGKWARCEYENPKSVAAACLSTKQIGDTTLLIVPRNKNVLNQQQQQQHAGELDAEFCSGKGRRRRGDVRGK